MGDYVPSRVRGPPIEGQTPQETKKLRQMASQNMTVKKKYEIRKDQAATICKAFSDVAVIVGGPGAVTGAVVVGYPKLTPRGTELGPNTMFQFDKIWSGNEVAQAQAVVRHQHVMPQYNVGHGYPEGTNRVDGGLSDLQAFKCGLKSELPGAIGNHRGLRMNDYAAHFIQMINQELQQEFGRQPTVDESKAAVLLSMLNARENMENPAIAKISVNNDYRLK